MAKRSAQDEEREGSSKRRRAEHCDAKTPTQKRLRELQEEAAATVGVASGKRERKQAALPGVYAPSAAPSAATSSRPGRAAMTLAASAKQRQVQQPKGKAGGAAKQQQQRAQQEQPERGGRGHGGGRGGGRSGRRQLLGSVKLDGQRFEAGDDVLVVVNPSKLGSLRVDDNEEYHCDVCGEPGDDRGLLVECQRCKCGIHCGCLNPPLEELPEEDWLCPDCEAGKPVLPRFLRQQGLGVARIESMWREADGEHHACLRWYWLPEETHRGRKLDDELEVFLTPQRDEASMFAILRKVSVLRLTEFDRAERECSGCDSFRPRGDFDSGSDEEEAGAASSDDEDEAREGRDATFRLKRGAGGGGGATRRGAAKKRQARGGGGLVGAGCVFVRMWGGNCELVGGEAYLRRMGMPASPERRQQCGGGGGGLSAARGLLTLQAVPRSLPCREAERQQVVEFVEEALSEDGRAQGKCLYISGIPGTGKTATVHEVMRGMRRRAEAGEAMTGERASPARAAAALEKMFSGGGGGALRQPTIVLVDEMDLLVNKSQTVRGVLYNLFDWPGRKGSNLSIVSIANTMDLPERLHPRIGSRLAGRRVVFHPYTREQLERIVGSRLEGVPAFDARAVTFIARKVANCSGDVRRCLELCRRRGKGPGMPGRAPAPLPGHPACSAPTQGAGRPVASPSRLRRRGPHTARGACRAAEVAEEEAQEKGQELGKVQVLMPHVNRAIQEMFNSSHMRLLHELPRLDAALLAALLREQKITGLQEALLEDVDQRLRDMCTQGNQPPFQFASVLERTVELGAKRLIICDGPHRRLKAKVALNLPAADLVAGLRAGQQWEGLRWLAPFLEDAFPSYQPCRLAIASQSHGGRPGPGKDAVRALYVALLDGDAPTALQLIEGPQGRRLASASQSGLTAAHVAVAGGCRDALAPLVAAGARLDAGLGETIRCYTLPEGLRQLLPEDAQAKLMAAARRASFRFLAGYTPLAVAVGSERGASCLAFNGGMQLGRSLIAHLERRRATGELALRSPCQAVQVVLGALRGGHTALRDHGVSALADMLIEDGGDNAWDWDEGWAGWVDPVTLSDLFLFVAISDLNAPESPPALRALLDSWLPCAAALRLRWDGGLHTRHTLLALACRGAARGATVPLLRAAAPDAPLQARDLLGVIDGLESLAPLEALLAVGTPPVDLGKHVVKLVHEASWSCPIHRLIWGQVCQVCAPRSQVCAPRSVWALECGRRGPPNTTTTSPGCLCSAATTGTGGHAERRRWVAMRALELLLGAGYRPAQYENAAPPQFLEHLHTYYGGHPVASWEPRPLLDPMDFHPPCAAQLAFVARGSSWSRADHHIWPADFRAATRLLLLAGSSAGLQPAAAETRTPATRRRQGGRAERRLGGGGGPTPSVSRLQGGAFAGLPADVLLRVLELAAAPMSNWMLLSCAQQAARSMSEQPSWAGLPPALLAAVLGATLPPLLHRVLGPPVDCGKRRRAEAAAAAAQGELLSLSLVCKAWAAAVQAAARDYCRWAITVAAVGGDGELAQALAGLRVVSLDLRPCLLSAILRRAARRLLGDAGFLRRSGPSLVAVHGLPDSAAPLLAPFSALQAVGLRDDRGLDRPAGPVALAALLLGGCQLEALAVRGGIVDLADVPPGGCRSLRLAAIDRLLLPPAHGCTVVDWLLDQLELRGIQAFELLSEAGNLVVQEEGHAPLELELGDVFRLAQPQCWPAGTWDCGMTGDYEFCLTWHGSDPPAVLPFD
eukprot:scaffold40.g5150.t1